MKKDILIIVILFFVNNSFSQNNFELLISSPNDESISDIIEETDNSIVLVGTQRENYSNYNFSNAKLLHISSDGEILQDINYEIEDSLYSFTDIVKTDFGYITVGLATAKNNIENYNNIVIGQLDDDFNLIKRKTHKYPYGAIDYLKTKRINNSLITYTTYKEADLYKILIYKFSLDGDTIFTKKMNLSEGQYLGLIYDILYINSNKYYLLTNGFSDHSRMEIVAVDSLFNIDEVSDVPDAISGFGSLKWFSDNSFVMSGTKVVFDNKFQDNEFSLSIIDTNYNIINEQLFGTSDTTDHPALRDNIDFIDKNSIFMGGMHHFSISLQQFQSPDNWVMIVNTDSELNLNWQKFYGGDACYYMYNILATQDGGCLMVGTRYDEKIQTDERDIYIIKTDPNGNITHINGEPSEQKAKEVILYPNPATSELTIQKAVQVGKCTVEFYSITGKKVFSQNLTNSTTKIDISNLEKGSYIYKISDNNKIIETGKWIKQ